MPTFKERERSAAAWARGIRLREEEQKQRKLAHKSIQRAKRRKEAKAKLALDRAKRKLK